MSEKTKLWDKLGRTDPAHTKQFTRSGGFKGTAIKPMWAYKRMTEEFGPCGIGWGVGEPTFQIVPGPDGEVLVYCTASVWYRDGDQISQTVYGVGGDKVVGKNKYGLSSDDEACKKAFTDAVTNALKLIGVGADVHMGLFDDSKYVNTVRQEFADEQPQQTNVPPIKSSAQLKREGSWDELIEQFNKDVQDCHSLVALESIKAIYRAKATDSGWPAAWKNALKDQFDAVEKRIMDELEKEPA